MDNADLIRSMSQKGCSPDNAACEGIFGTSKDEVFYIRTWKDVSLEGFISELDGFLHWYTEDPIKMSLGAMSPTEARESFGLVA